MSQSEIEHLKAQISVARNEIKNLRQQVSNLQHVHRKDIQNISCALENLHCRSTSETKTLISTTRKNECDQEHTNSIIFNPVGTIKTVFSDKRAVPRQASVASELSSRIELNPTIFNNPEHSLEGLKTFSHIWILYHFHRNPAHFKAKVAPPRLDGARVGVFSTRSPHRPCPIGLSLVKIDRIEKSVIYFFGTDMVDGTPVLDIKPYIPKYDIPSNIDQQQFLSCREAPDGEEKFAEAVPSSSSKSSTHVKVPKWISNGSTLNVLFNENAGNQIQNLGIQKKSIEDILKADPRSVYLRTKYGSQIYTFQLGDYTVTCKFDDHQSSVNVLQIRKLIDLNEIADTIENETSNR